MFNGIKGAEGAFIKIQGPFQRTLGKVIRDGFISISRGLRW